MPSRRPTSSAHRGAMDDLAQQYGSHSVSGGSFSDDDFSDELPSYASHRPSARDPGVGRSSQGGEHRSLRDPRHGMPSQMGSRRSGMPPGHGSIPPPGASSRHTSSRQSHGQRPSHTHDRRGPMPSWADPELWNYTPGPDPGRTRTASLDARSGQWVLDGPGPHVVVDPYAFGSLNEPKHWRPERMPVFSEDGRMICSVCKKKKVLYFGWCIDHIL